MGKERSPSPQGVAEVLEAESQESSRTFAGTTVTGFLLYGDISRAMSKQQ